MAKEKCKECKGTLVLDEENLCAYCELKLGNTPSIENPLSVDCGVCQVIVEEVSEGLFCDVCNTWFHNDCNKTPLHYDLYALLNDAPQNVKWFCDKCIWETEKWITQIIDKQKKSIREGKVQKQLNGLSNESGKVCGLNSVANGQLNGEGYKDVNVDNTEGQIDNHHSKTPEIKLEIDHGPEYMESEDTHNAIDSDEWIPTEEKKKVIKFKPKKKIKKYIIHTGDKPYQSSQCDKVFSQKIGLDCHLRTHTGEKPGPYQCSLCGIAFTRRHSLKIHVRKHTGEKPDKCSYCDKAFSCKSYLNNHLWRTHGESTSIISEEVVTENLLNILDISEENLSNLRAELHVIQKLKHKQLKCTLCPRSFRCLENYIVHKLKFHEGIKKPHKCPVCKMIFETKSMRILHMEKHDDTLKLKCDICNKKLKNHVTLRTHLKLFHMDDKFHSCTECEYTAKYKENVTMHMIKEHAFETKFQCTICTVFFVSKRYLNDHMLIHNPDKLFSCEVCNKKFKTAKQSKKHTQRLHASEKPFECIECGKKFITERFLNNHTLTHLPIEQRISKVICDICGKVLRDLNCLKRHMMMHNDERPLKCEICGKGFRHSGHLNLHIKYHKKIITDSCPICGFGARSKDRLNIHMKLVHTNETPFECDTCGNKYKTKGNLSKHKRGIRGSCKGFNSSDSSIKDKREPKTSGRSYYEEDESKKEDSPIHFQENYSSTAFTSAIQIHENHPVLLFANSHNSNVYQTQYQGSLIPPNSRGITATIHTSPIS